MQVAKKLNVPTPPPSLVDAYLAEIAKGYGVKWSPPGAPTNEDEDADGGGGVKASASRIRGIIMRLMVDLAGRKREGYVQPFACRCRGHIGGGKERWCANA